MWALWVECCCSLIHVCVCMNMCVFMWVWVLCMCGGGKTTTSGVSSIAIYLVFETGFLTGLELVKCAKLDSCGAPEIYLSLPPQSWYYKYIPSEYLAFFLFNMGSGDHTQIFVRYPQSGCASSFHYSVFTSHRSPLFVWIRDWIQVWSLGRCDLKGNGPQRERHY